MDDFRVVTMYCGMFLVEDKGLFACVNIYTNTVECKGTENECRKHFDKYVARICERDWR